MTLLPPGRGRPPLGGGGCGTIFGGAADTLNNDHQMEMIDAIHGSVEPNNNCERVDGYAPARWCLGWMKGWADQLTATEGGDIDLPKASNEKCQLSLQRRIQAQKMDSERI